MFSMAISAGAVTGLNTCFQKGMATAEDNDTLLSW